MAAKTMSLDLIQEMVNNYKTKQYYSIVTNTINPMSFDAQSIWFDLEVIKKFIATLEDEVAKHPEHGLSNFGIRFYYSAYPDIAKWDDPGYETLANLNQRYSKLHTLVAIPTAVINGVNSDFDPFDAKTYDGTKPTGAGTAIMAENHGPTTPPLNTNGLWF